MENDVKPYVERNAGDLWTAEDWNDVQVMIKNDIKSQVDGVKDSIETVPHADEADNALKVEGKTLDELRKEITEAIKKDLPTQVGYKLVFKKLAVDEESQVRHELAALPLVDLYQLEYFEVGASEDGITFTGWVNFYLYHSSERRLRFRDETQTSNPVRNVEIEPADGFVYKIPFTEMLRRYDVDYTEDSSLGDLETEFWKALFAEPNDTFDDDQYAKSPWFDRCCREDRTVQSLMQRRDWNDLWFQMRPRKTVNYPYLSVGDPTADPPILDGSPNPPIPPEPMPSPTQIDTVHLDFNTLGLKLLRPPVYPAELRGDAANNIPPLINLNELKVLLILKV